MNEIDRYRRLVVKTIDAFHQALEATPAERREILLRTTRELEAGLAEASCIDAPHRPPRPDEHGPCPGCGATMGRPGPRALQPIEPTAHLELEEARGLAAASEPWPLALFALCRR